MCTHPEADMNPLRVKLYRLKTCFTSWKDKKVKEEVAGGGAQIAAMPLLVRLHDSTGASGVSRCKDIFCLFTPAGSVYSEIIRIPW